MILQKGEEYRVSCPFVRAVYTYYDEGGSYSSITWRPGIVFECAGPHGDDSYPVAHGVGTVVYRIVDIHKLPHPYPARAFYVRTWIDPDGRSFGKTSLRISTADALRRRIQGFRVPGCDDEYLVQDIDAAEKAQMIAGAE